MSVGLGVLDERLVEPGPTGHSGSPSATRSTSTSTSILDRQGYAPDDASDSRRWYGADASTGRDMVGLATFGASLLVLGVTMVVGWPAPRTADRPAA